MDPPDWNGQGHPPAPPAGNNRRNGGQPTGNLPLPVEQDPYYYHPAPASPFPLPQHHQAPAAYPTPTHIYYQGPINTFSYPQGHYGIPQYNMGSVHGGPGVPGHPPAPPTAPGQPPNGFNNGSPPQYMPPTYPTSNSTHPIPNQINGGGHSPPLPMAPAYPGSNRAHFDPNRMNGNGHAPRPQPTGNTRVFHIGRPSGRAPINGSSGTASIASTPFGRPPVGAPTNGSSGTASVATTPFSLPSVGAPTNGSSDTESTAITPEALYRDLTQHQNQHPSAYSNAQGPGPSAPLSRAVQPFNANSKPSAGNSSAPPTPLGNYTQNLGDLREARARGSSDEPLSKRQKSWNPQASPVPQAPSASGPSAPVSRAVQIPNANSNPSAGEISYPSSYAQYIGHTPEDRAGESSALTTQMGKNYTQNLKRLREANAKARESYNEPLSKRQKASKPQAPQVPQVPQVPQAPSAAPPPAQQPPQPVASPSPAVPDRAKSPVLPWDAEPPHLPEKDLSKIRGTTTNWVIEPDTSTGLQNTMTALLWKEAMEKIIEFLLMVEPGKVFKQYWQFQELCNAVELFIARKGRRDLSRKELEQLIKIRYAFIIEEAIMGGHSPLLDINSLRGWEVKAPDEMNVAVRTAFEQRHKYYFTGGN